MSAWMNDKLSSLLEFPVPQDMTDYVMSIENNQDLEDYLKTLLDFNNPSHQAFFHELIDRRRRDGNSLDAHGYKKPPTMEDDISPKQGKKKKSANRKELEKYQKEKFETDNQALQTKKKSKYVNLYSQEGRQRDVILLKGRHRCDCQASKHHLINNCLKCGRIVCEQEGSGPCVICSSLVCSREEQQLLSAGSKQSQRLYNTLLEQEKPEGWNSAIEQRDRLLEYDRTSERRTHVIDDESDYYSTNSVWLSEGERDALRQKEEALRAKKHASRRDQQFTMDFAGRRIMPDEPDYEDEVLQEISSSMNSSSDRLIQLSDDNIDSRIFLALQPRFQENVIDYHNWQNVGSVRDVNMRVQDKELLEMVDQGFCLSIHQPWASLLVAGIKVHEGRSWYTAHRGRLWIAAAASAPQPELIREQEQVYTLLKRDKVVFPSQYPVSCLLGCVTVTECLPQEEYQERFPEGESDSPFVLICEDPYELPIRFPIQGKHKIYQLDPKIHQAAQKSLQRVARIRAGHKRSFIN